MLAVKSTIPRAMEQRRHRRVPVSVLGRYMLENRLEYPCRTFDISPGGASIIAPVKGEVGERVVAYLEHIGRVEGPITREIENGFAMSIQASLRKRDKIATQLTWLANRHALGLPEDRRHERVVPRKAGSTMRLEDGREIEVRLIDISMSGAAVACDTSPPLGAPVVIGKTPAQVVRHAQGGFAIEFRQAIQPYDLDEDMVL